MLCRPPPPNLTLVILPYCGPPLQPTLSHPPLPPLTVCPPVPGYQLLEGLDVIGHDLDHIYEVAGVPADIAAFCDNRTDCLGFNADGFLLNFSYATAR